MEEQLSKLYYEVRSLYFSCEYAGSGECKGCNRYQLCDALVTSASYLLQASKLANSFERKEQK